MRKFFLVSVLMNFYILALSQTNIFPPSGNVGIGTNSPASWFGTSPLLHINGSRPTISFTPIEVNGLATIQWKGLTSSSEFHLNFVDGETSKLSFSSYQHEGGVLPVLFLNGNGNVGIGVDNPTVKLQVGGDISASKKIGFIINDAFDVSGNSVAHYGISLINGTGYNDVALSGYYGLEFYTWGQQRIKISNNGNVGIGTPNPDSKLTLFNDVENGSPYLLNVGGTGNGWIKVRHIDGKDYQSGEVGDLYFQYMKNKNTIINAGEGSGNVGIGTEQPTCKLSVAGDIILSDSYSRTFSFGNIALLQSSFDAYGSLNFRLHNGSGFSDVLKISGNGEYNLNVSGKIRANEIVVNTTGADFVFDPEYNLPELSEVERYIEENKHLPDVAPASVMQTEGMSVSEMQTKLLQKMEEMTLYIIDQEKRIKLLEEKLKDYGSANQ